MSSTSLYMRVSATVVNFNTLMVNLLVICTDTWHLWQSLNISAKVFCIIEVYIRYHYVVNIMLATVVFGQCFAWKLLFHISTCKHDIVIYEKLLNDKARCVLLVESRLFHILYPTTAATYVAANTNDRCSRLYKCGKHKRKTSWLAVLRFQ